MDNIKWHSFNVGITEQGTLIFRCTKCSAITTTLKSGLCDYCKNNINIKKINQDINKILKLYKKHNKK